ncbi:MAG: hypothetical protein AB1411_04940 [Nitrospirota bacterium]
MSDQVKPALDVIRAQIRELDAILEQGRKTLNTVAAGERLARWKRQAVALLAQHLGPREAGRLESTTPGPSFTNDLLEELTDDVELYRNVMVSLEKELKQRQV